MFLSVGMLKTILEDNMMNKGFSWILVVFWLITLAMLVMDMGMMAMYMMVIGMLADSLYSALHK